MVSYVVEMTHCLSRPATCAGRKLQETRISIQGTLSAHCTMYAGIRNGFLGNVVCISLENYIFRNILIQVNTYRLELR